MFFRSLATAIAGLALTSVLAAPASAQPLAATTGTLPDVCADPNQTSCNRGILYIINGATLQVDAAIDIWRGLLNVFVHKVAIHPGGTLAYVQLQVGVTPTSRSIEVIDLRTRTRVTGYAVPGNLRTISDDGTLLYVVTSTAVVAIDSATGAVVSTFPIADPADVAVARNSNRMYVAAGTPASFAVAVLDRTSGALIQNIPLPLPVISIKLTPDETHLYALVPASRIFDIDTATNTIAGTITSFGGPSSPNSFAFARGRAYVAVSSQSPGIGTEVIAVFDVATRALLTTVLTVDPIFVGASADGTRVWTATLGEPRAITIDTATNQIIGPIATPGGPLDFVAVPTQRQSSLAVEQPSAGSLVLQPFTMSGWAVDVMGVLPGPGVSTVHVWAFPATGGAPTFVGADYGRSRPDIGALFGPSFTNSGYQVTVRGLTPGAYELRAFGLSTRTGDFTLSAAVGVTIAPGARLVVDAPASGTTVNGPFVMAGWALDGSAASGTGVDAVHVWAYPASGGSPTFAGAAILGDARPDVGAAFGAQFTNAGFHLTISPLPPDTYTLVVYGHSSVTGTFSVEQHVVVTFPAPTPMMFVDAPAPTADLGSSFRIAGWALELNAPSGTGVDVIHVWATAPSGAATFLGAATYGLERPDIRAWLGARYAPSGFLLDATLTPGAYVLSIYARSTTTGTFRTVRIVSVTVVSGAWLVVETPAGGTTVAQPLALSGYALDTRAASGTGVDAVHVWAYPAAGGTPTFAGAATMGDPRPDIAARFGAAFVNAGYHLTVSGLPPGPYTLVVYGHSTVTGTFSVEQHVVIMIPAPSMPPPVRSPG